MSANSIKAVLSQKIEVSVMGKRYKKSDLKSIKRNGKWLISDGEKDHLLCKPPKLKLRPGKQFYVPKDQDYSQGSLTIYEHGALINKGVKIMGKQIVSPGGLRGDIKTFSAAARRRMRLFMLTHNVNPDLIECSVTLTVPGPIMTAEEKKSLWKYWTDEVNRKGWACLWRLELQKRGQFHWHCIMGLKMNYGSFQGHFERIIEKAKKENTDQKYRHVMKKDKNESPYKKWYTCQEYLLKDMVTELWSKVLPADRQGFVRDHTVELEMDRTGYAWRRYMQDHASKLKQEQLSDTGKQWGIINRKLFTSSQVVYDVDFLSRRHWCIFNRPLMRLKNGVSKKKKRFKRISQGKSVSFGKKDTFIKLYDWSVIEYLERIEYESIPF